MAEGEDESFRKFRQEIEQKCLSKSAPKKRKQYLGPDSIDVIPRTSKYRYETSRPSSEATEDVSSAIDEPGCLQSTLNNQIDVGYLSVQNYTPVPHSNLFCHQATSDCKQVNSSASYNQVRHEIILDAKSSTVSKDSSATNDINSTTSRFYWEETTTAFSSIPLNNQIQVAPLLFEHTTAINLSHCQSNSSCNPSASPSDFLVSMPDINLGANTSKITGQATLEVSDNAEIFMGITGLLGRNCSQVDELSNGADGNQVDCMANSQVIYDAVTHNSTPSSEKETEASSERENSEPQSCQSHHQSHSSSTTSSRDSRSPSESSMSLLDSDNESNADEQGEYDQPVNDHDGCGHEERGIDQEEQDVPDQFAGEEGREIDRMPDEQQNGGAGEEREQEEQMHEGGGRPPTHGKLREAMLGGFLNNIEVPIGASRNDILFMALSLSSRNNESNTAFCKLIEMINCLFVSPILPCSQYLLDNLLVSDVGTHYHFYCKTCFKSFGEPDFKNIKFRNCENCNTSNNVSDLRLSSFFVIFDLPIQLEIILSKPELAEALSTPAEATARCRAGLLSDIYSGSMYQEFCASVANFQERIISMHLSVDGSPIANSSSASIWPIQGLIHELPPNMRMKNLLLCGLWFGKSHPKMNLFLPPFVFHMRTLSRGFQLRVGPNMWDTRLYCVGCCVDSGARGSVQGIKTHGGFFACNWCKICGAYIENAVRYPLTERRPDDRTHDEMVMLQRRLVRRRAARAGLLAVGEEMEQELQVEEEEEEEEENNDEPNEPRNPEMYGVISASALLNLPQFSMVNGFFVENMHCVDMGIVKGQISLWLEGAGMPYYIKGSLPELNRRILALRPPLEFRRMPRTLKERLNYKAREYNNFLWYSYIILKDILPNRYLNSWLLLIQAIFLLSQAEVTIQHINIAETLIIHYLAAVQVQYGEKNMSFNLHILRHLGAHVRRWGPLWATSAYVFEDGNGHLKNLIHTVQCVPHQVIRHWSWDLARQILYPHVSDKARNYASSIFKQKHHNKVSYLTGDCRLIGKPKLANLSEEETFVCEENQQPVENLHCYDKLVYKNCAYVAESKRCARTCNSVAQLNDKTVVLIRKILFDTENDRVFLFVSDINWEPVMTLPEAVAMDRDDHCLRNVLFIHEELRFIKVLDLRIVCFRTKLPHCDLLSVLPNVQNRH